MLSSDRILRRDLQKILGTAASCLLSLILFDLFFPMFNAELGSFLKLIAACSFLGFIALALNLSSPVSLTACVLCHAGMLLVAWRLVSNKWSFDEDDPLLVFLNLGGAATIAVAGAAWGAYSRKKGSLSLSIWLRHALFYVTAVVLIFALNGVFRHGRYDALGTEMFVLMTGLFCGALGFSADDAIASGDRIQKAATAESSTRQ